jgi:hypothetical protein
VTPHGTSICVGARLPGEGKRARQPTKTPAWHAKGFPRNPTRGKQPHEHQYSGSACFKQAVFGILPKTPTYAARRIQKRRPPGKMPSGAGWKPALPGLKDADAPTSDR